MKKISSWQFPIEWSYPRMIFSGKYPRGRTSNGIAMTEEHC
jgi:hypothetical protein